MTKISNLKKIVHANLKICLTGCADKTLFNFSFHLENVILPKDSFYKVCLKLLHIL